MLFLIGPWALTCTNLFTHPCNSNQTAVIWNPDIDHPFFKNGSKYYCNCSKHTPPVTALKTALPVTTLKPAPPVIGEKTCTPCNRSKTIPVNGTEFNTARLVSITLCCSHFDPVVEFNPSWSIFFLIPFFWIPLSSLELILHHRIKNWSIGSTSLPAIQVIDNWTY